MNMKSKVSIVKCDSYEPARVKEAVKKLQAFMEKTSGDPIHLTEIMMNLDILKKLPEITLVEYHSILNSIKETKKLWEDHLNESKSNL